MRTAATTKEKIILKFQSHQEKPTEKTVRMTTCQTAQPSRI